MDGFPPGAILPAIDFDEIQVREVYSRFGLAMYMAQVLEHGMVSAIVVMKTLPSMRMHTDEKSWQDTFDKAYEAGLARTYGNIICQLEAITEFSDALLGRIRDAKPDRDVLAHRFFRENDLAFMNRDGRTAMITWCEARIEIFSSLSGDIETFIAPIRERNGISQAWIDRATDQALEDARNWSPPI